MGLCDMTMQSAWPDVHSLAAVYKSEPTPSLMAHACMVVSNHKRDYYWENGLRD